MKVFALLCGILAALIWVALGLLVADTLTPFVAIWQSGGGDPLIGRIVWYAVPAISLVGAVSVLASPVLSGLLMLLAAGGWFALGSLAPQGLDLKALLALAAAGIGALAAFLAVRKPNEAPPQRAPSLEDIAREQALSADPSHIAPMAVPRAPSPVSRSEPARISYPPSEPGRGVSGLVVVNFIVTLLLAGLLGLMLYRDYAVEGRPLPWQGQRGAAVQPGAPAPPASPAARPEASAAPAAAPASVQPAAFADPFRYCAFVDTIDSPDSRYSGPAFTAPIAQAVRAPMSSSPDRVRWRCVDGAVWACSSFDWPVCSITPSVAEMMEFCTRNPGARNLQAPSGSWSCEGTRPVIPPNQNWPVDARGFLPQAWVRVPAPA